MLDMLEKKADFGFLGGQRQRYLYYSFDRCGTSLSFSVNRTNLRHCFGKDAKSGLTVRELTEKDTAILAELTRINRARPFHFDRPADKILDILQSWSNAVCGIFDGETCAGYFVYKPNECAEFYVSNVSCLPDALLSVFAFVGDDVHTVTFDFAPYETGMIAFFTEIAENFSLHCTGGCTVLNFERVLGALLRLKASYVPLADGAVTVLIRGYAGEETLRLEVRGGIPFVTKFDGKVEFELSHSLAMQAFFGLSGHGRGDFPAAAQSWLPLPLQILRPDHV
jgi:hypothetical protein